MIFITVGTANKGFDRLIKKCDEIAAKHKITCFVQTGSSGYEPVNMPYQRWLTPDEIKHYYQIASAFVIHGGFGTLSEVLDLGKPVIVVPRTFDNGEAVNDQSDISIKLDNMGYVKCITNLDELEQTLLNIHQLDLKKYDLVSDIPQILLEQLSLLKK